MVLDLLPFQINIQLIRITVIKGNEVHAKVLQFTIVRILIDRIEPKGGRYPF